MDSNLIKNIFKTKNKNENVIPNRYIDSTKN